MNLVFSTKPKMKSPSILMENIHTPPPTIRELVQMDQIKKDPLPKQLFQFPTNPNLLQLGMFDRLKREPSQGCGGCGKHIQ